MRCGRGTREAADALRGLVGIPIRREPHTQGAFCPIPHRAKSNAPVKKGVKYVIVISFCILNNINNHILKNSNLKYEYVC